ncbi:MAG TPA: RIP metalloprotease RseP, partial [Luteimonas sp.]|nr:RIP metalloprotease RseP [Luteimonas sp.]
YVKMLDEREAPVAQQDLSQAFNRQSVGRRIAIVAAGPFANLLLCFALLWGMFVIGRPDYAPVVGHVEGIAAMAQLKPGDTILAVGDRQTPTWSEAALALATAAVDRKDIAVRVHTALDGDAVRNVPLSRLPADFDEQGALQAVGLTPRHQLLPPVVGRIEPGSPAWGVLAEGDTLTAIDGDAVPSFDDIGPLVQKVGHRTAMIEVQRDGDRLALEVTPTQRSDPARGRYWALGIGPRPATAPAYDARLQFGPVAAVPAALNETWKLTSDSVAMIGRLLSGHASAGNVSGPITIARYANASAKLGPAWFLNFLALMSLSLAIINILPIPVLDGGHLLYYLIELAKGSPLSERAMAAGQYIGLGLLAGLMGLAFYNDILQLLR